MFGLRISLLGSPQVESDGTLIPISRSKALALLIYLAASGERKRRDTLAALLWPESPQRLARSALRRELSFLNKKLGGKWLAIERETLGLSPEVWIDINQFHRHVRDAGSAEAVDTGALVRAIDIYRADFLTGFTLRDCPQFDDWQFAQSEELREQFALTLDLLIRAYLEQVDYSFALPHARRRLAVDPLHEEAHRTLMQLYALSGQQAAALRQYEICARTLEVELGLTPAEETTRLHRQIRLGELGRAAESSTPEASREPSAIAHNLPPQPTAFVGREAELFELDALIARPETRLITIVGPGGMGKTRLALVCAEKQLEAGHFADDVFFASLASLSTAEHIGLALAEALGFSLTASAQQRTPWQQVLDYLRRKRILLVLDNFEHLLSGAALLSELLLAAPNVCLLATSREPLRMREEQIFAIQGLDCPECGEAENAAEYPAVKLFTQSARRVRHDFELAGDDLTSLACICCSIGGLPLGIELAASWVDTLSIADIAAELQQGLDLLESDLRNVPERHRSIRTVFAQSWQRLSESERDTLAQREVRAHCC